MTSQQYRRRNKIPAIGSTWRAIEASHPLNAMEWLEPAEQAPPASSDVVPQPAPGGPTPVEARRADDIAVEIELVASQLEATGARVTAASVMGELIERAGSPDSCITEAVGKAVLWLRGSTGQPEKLDMETLKSRLARRRQRANVNSKGNAKPLKGDA